jgi:hypothetical protein
MMAEITIEEGYKKLGEMVKEIALNRKYHLEEIENGYVVDVPVLYSPEECESGEAETRQQFVYLTANRTNEEGEQLFQIFTICAPEDERFYKSAMLLNMNLPFGAFAIAEVEGVNYFVLVDTYHVKEVSIGEMEKSIMTLANAGDRMERMLIGDDIS